MGTERVPSKSQKIFDRTPCFGLKQPHISSEWKYIYPDICWALSTVAAAAYRLKQDRYTLGWIGGLPSALARQIRANTLTSSPPICRTELRMLPYKLRDGPSIHSTFSTELRMLLYKLRYGPLIRIHSPFSAYWTKSLESRYFPRSGPCEAASE